MTQRLFVERDFRQCGLMASDMRGVVRKTLETWRLPDPAARLLRTLLIDAGFEPDAAIQVRESTTPPGFVLAQ